MAVRGRPLDVLTLRRVQYLRLTLNLSVRRTAERLALSPVTVIKYTKRATRM